LNSLSLGFDELLEAIEELLTELDETLLDDLTLDELTLDDELFAELEETLLDEEAAVSAMQRTGKYTSLPEKLETDTPDPS
jgi:hypothetical protein